MERRLVPVVVHASKANHDRSWVRPAKLSDILCQPQLQSQCLGRLNLFEVLAPGFRIAVAKIAANGRKTSETNSQDREVEGVGGEREIAGQSSLQRERSIRIDPASPGRFQIVALQFVSVFDLLVVGMGRPALESSSRYVDERLLGRQIES